MLLMYTMYKPFFSVKTWERNLTRNTKKGCRKPLSLSLSMLWKRVQNGAIIQHHIHVLDLFSWGIRMNDVNQLLASTAPLLALAFSSIPPPVPRENAGSFCPQLLVSSFLSPLDPDSPRQANPLKLPSPASSSLRRNPSTAWRCPCLRNLPHSCNLNTSGS